MSREAKSTGAVPPSPESDPVTPPTWGGKISSLRDEIAEARCACLAGDHAIAGSTETRADSVGLAEARTRRLVALGRLDRSLAVAEEAWVAVCRTTDRGGRELGPYGPR